MLESADDEEVLVAGKPFGGDANGAGCVLYRKKQPLRLLNNVNVTCVPGNHQKQQAISGIIR